VWWLSLRRWSPKASAGGLIYTPQARAKVRETHGPTSCLCISTRRTNGTWAVTAHIPVSYFGLGTLIEGSADHAEAYIDATLSKLLILSQRRLHIRAALSSIRGVWLYPLAQPLVNTWLNSCRTSCTMCLLFSNVAIASPNRPWVGILSLIPQLIPAVAFSPVCRCHKIWLITSATPALDPR
jgi:hypothetical protein